MRAGAEKNSDADEAAPMRQQRGRAPLDAAPEAPETARSDRLARGAARRQAAHEDRKGRVHPFIWAMFAAMFLPVELSVQAGPLTLSPYKIIMVVIAVPVFIQYCKQCRVTLPDGLFFAYTLYTLLCILINRALQGIETGAIFMLHTGITYMAVRVAIRTVDDFRAVIRLFVGIIAILGVLAIPEMITHKRYLGDFFTQFTGYYFNHAMDTRFGLLRATSTFEHPILFGLGSAALLTYVWVFTRTKAAGIWNSLKIGVAAIASLSSVAFLIFFFQTGMLIAERMTRGIAARGIMLMSSILFVVTFLNLASNRGTIELIISYLTLNPHTGYYRILIWNYGIQDVMNNPIFGFRREEWNHPAWMTDSIDNHWLMVMIDGGIPALVFLFAMMLTTGVKLARAPSLRTGALQEPPHARVRERSQRSGAKEKAPRGTLDLNNGWIFSIIALFLGGATVTFFGQMVPIFSMHLAFGPALLAIIAGNGAAEGRLSAAERRAARASRQTGGGRRRKGKRAGNPTLQSGAES